MVGAGGKEPRGGSGSGSAAERGPGTSIHGGGACRQLYACRPAAEEGRMFPPAFVSPAPSPVTHLLIAAIVCHRRLGSFLSDLK